MQKLVIFCLMCTLVSCNLLEQEDPRVPVARVNKSFLYEEDVKELISETTSEEDSTLIVNNYINRWATQQLLIDQAKINLSEQKQEAYNKLVRNYKNDLFTEAYKSAIVMRQLDSTVSQGEFEDFYDLNKINFRLNDILVKVRYIHVDENFTDLQQTKEKFVRYNESDKTQLNDMAIQFKANNLNDSVWVKKEAIVAALPVIKDKAEQVLKKSNFTQLQDSLGLYLVKIQDVLKANDIAPLSYVKPTIKQIIINKRKLELIKKFEIDITKDAIKNDNFEIYQDK